MSHHHDPHHVPHRRHHDDDHHDHHDDHHISHASGWHHQVHHNGYVDACTAAPQYPYYGPATPPQRQYPAGAAFSAIPAESMINTRLIENK